MEPEEEKVEPEEPPVRIEKSHLFYEDLLFYEPQSRQDKWSVSWSDLMMTMFIFFAVLYIYQASGENLVYGKGPGKDSISEQGGGNVININEEKNPLEVYDETRRAVQDVMIDKESFYTLEKDRTVRIVLAGDLFFDTGRANLKAGARYQLNQIAKALNDNSYIINVVGHTDDVPTRSAEFPSNWELSADRACRVARYLIDEGNVEESRFFISAHAFHQPLERNDTPENRALNRRVEIILIKEKPFGTSG